MDCDVLIVGAGLAGLRVAEGLAKRGCHVLLVDRLANPGAVIRTTGIFVRRTLDDFDIPASLLGPAVRRVSLYGPSRRALELKSDHDEFRVGRMRAIYRYYFDRARSGGVRWLGGARFVAAEAIDGGSFVTLRSHDAVNRLSARFIVGADGARSIVARELGLEQNRRVIVGVEDVFSATMKRDEPRFHCFLDPRLAPGYIGWLVDDGEQVHVGVGGDPSRFAAGAALDAFEHEIADRLPSSPRLERRAGLIPVGGVLRRIVNERGLLVGDAAGAVSPLTAGGLDACFRLSDAAVKVIANFFRTESRSALADYSGAAIRTRFVSRLWMRALYEKLSSPFAIEVALALLQTPLLRPLATKIVFGRGSFPDVVVPDLALGYNRRA